MPQGLGNVAIMGLPVCSSWANKFIRRWDSDSAPTFRNSRAHTGEVTIADLAKISGRRYPARRLTQNVAGGASPIQASQFCLGYVTLDPDGGQVPWHNQEQEEIYFVIEGDGEMCLGEERSALRTGQAVYIPPRVFHQLTNLGSTPLKMIYCYGPAGDVAHWKQELAGTLPRAGVDVPALPEGAQPQCTSL